MNVAALSEQTAADWRAIAAEAAESWFYHTPEWLAFVKAIGAGALVGDLSFLLYRDGVPVAICPLILEERDGYRRFTYLGEFVPFPAFAAWVDEGTRAKAIDVYASHVEALSREHGAAYTRVMLPALSGAAVAGGQPWNPLLRHGYLDVSAATQVLSLEPAEDALWRGIRKGHRSDIKRAASGCAVAVWDEQSVTDAKFDEYRTLHAIDAGRVTRAGATFEMMLSWLRAGRAVLVEAARDGAPVAFAVIIRYRAGAYYASSCKLPDLELPAMHLVQWETIKWLKAHGVGHYDLGMQYFAPSWHYVPSAKDISIAAFKRGFGGVTHRVDVVERFFSAAVLDQIGRARLHDLVAAQEQQ